MLTDHSDALGRKTIAFMARREGQQRDGLVASVGQRHQHAGSHADLSRRHRPFLGVVAATTEETSDDHGRETHFA